MASDQPRGDGDWEAPKFFKIVIDPHCHKLSIPKEFAKKYGKSLPNIVFLEVRSGSVISWKVELRRCSDGVIWLHKGWKEFKEYYLIGFGYLLLFKYVGNSCFRVFIFDSSATEIEYPKDNGGDGAINRTAPEVSKLESGSESDGDSVVFLEELLASRNSKGKRKVVEANQEDDDAIDTKHQEMKKSATNCSISFNTYSLERRGPEIVKKARLNYQKATDFVSNNASRKPFLISVMQLSSVSGSYALTIPLRFIRENLPGAKNISITLYNAKAKKWIVRCNVAKSLATLDGGWKYFVRQNGVQLGDACVFEVAKMGPKPRWKVTIFHS